MSDVSAMIPCYVSCIKVDGKPILPPLLNDERRQEMRALRDQALAVESRLKEKKREELVKQVKNILSKCMTPDGLNITEVASSNYSLMTKPLYVTPVKSTKGDSQLPSKESYRAHSLPTTPSYDEKSIDQLHKNFLAMKDDCKDISFSEASAVSTDLGKYMNNQDTDSESGDSTTPRAMSDTEASENLECSTPIKANKVRRLSYTLEAPSPVLLKLLQNKAATCEKQSPVPVPPLNLSIDTEKDGNRSAVEKTSESPYIMELQQTIVNYQESCNKENSPVKSGITEPSKKTKLDLNDDLVNGNANWQRVENKVLEEKSNSFSEDSNGNPPSQHGSDKKGNLLEEFILQQQKLMNELLEKQAKEQEKLVSLFKEQEQQLFVQLQSQSSRSISTPSKSPVCRNLEKTFGRSARAKQLFDSCRLSALVRGYLTRRLLATDRVKAIIQTIQDTTTCLKELNQGSLAILPSDIQLHQRLIQQLNGAIHSLHDIFFEWDVSERMLVIARDREKKAGQLIITGRPVRMRPRSRSLSSATMKSLERKNSKLEGKPETKSETKVESRQESRNSSRPSSASTVLPRTSPSSIGSSICANRRSPSSMSSSSYCTVQSNGSFIAKAKQLAVKSKKPWR